jgi:hypothetical protein
MTFVIYRTKGKPSLGDPDGLRDTAPDRGGRIPVLTESLAIAHDRRSDGRGGELADLTVFVVGGSFARVKVPRDELLPTPQTYRAALAAELIS